MRALAALLLALLLAACASAPRAPAEQRWSGRFSALATQGEWRESVSGRFLLEQRGLRYSLELSTPIGGTVARIESGPEGASARGLQIAETHGPDAEALSQELLGFALPVRGLPDWIQGRPYPGPSQRSDEILEQDGWRIRVLERDSQGEPRRLLFERAESPDAPAVRLQLVLDTPAS